MTVAGYYGEHCQYAVDNLCLVERCLNNATCVGNSTHYQCMCVPGFTGPHCEQDINECALIPCPHGVCVDGVNSYTCYCLPG